MSAVLLPGDRALRNVPEAEMPLYPDMVSWCPEADLVGWEVVDG